MKKSLYSVLTGCCSACRSRLVFVLLFASMGFAASAITKETIVTLSDQNRVVSAAYELHLSSKTAPFSNATVSLNHEDAWLFFDNIKPSLVIAGYLPNILVNGEALKPGINGRVAIYAHGTVVMPHPSIYKPLAVFTGENFSGESQLMVPQVFNNALGTFDNAIKSFKLKRGYMATFATAADGTGYSRVFIADDADIEVGVMPELLNGTVSFVRVFKHQYVTKKGWCDTGSSGRVHAGQANATWFYTWSADNYSTDDQEYAVIKQHLYWPGWDEIYNKVNCTQLLGYNEPEHAEQHTAAKCNCGGVISTDKAISFWPDFMKSGLRVGSPAATDRNWVVEFAAKCDANNYRLDYIAFHAYWGNTSPASWYSNLKYIHDKTGRPIWITEWNNGANWTTESWPTDTASQFTKQYNDIKAIMNVLDTAHFVERYAIYNWVEDKRAMILGDTLTRAGVYYANNKSKIAFNRTNEVVPGWIYSKPSLGLSYLTLTNKVKLTWTDLSGEFSRGYLVERRLNNGNYETVYSSIDASVLTYTEDVNPLFEGRVSYRLSLKTIAGSWVSSDVVSYFQTKGANNVQVGKLQLVNTDWSICVFPQKFTANPAVILGVPSYNNTMPITQRVKTVGTRSFYFHLLPWAYVSNPTMTKTDTLSVMTMPDGVYDFGGLPAVVGSQTSVAATWKTVTFAQPFDTVPVVFCTQVTSNTSFPTAVAVRNVTATGFELRLKCEEEITSTMLGEKVCYFAIKAGSGVIDGKRVTVGLTVGNTVGTSSYALDIVCDATYAQPALFAGMQTTADEAFASTLRYTVLSSAPNTFKVFKQRELSSTFTAMQKEQVGWMMMDLTPGQISGLGNGIKGLDLDMYTSANGSVLNFTIEKPSKVRVYDIFGRLQITGETNGSLDIWWLPVGTYIVYVDGYTPVKFLKW